MVPEGVWVSAGTIDRQSVAQAGKRNRSTSGNRIAHAHSLCMPPAEVDMNPTPGDGFRH